MKIFIAGATGRVASFLMKELLADGHQVVAGVRNPASLEAREGLEVVTMNLRSRVEDLSQLIVGVDALYFTAGSRGRDLLQTDAFGAVKLMQAAELAGVQRFIMLSSFHATDPSQWDIYEEMEHVDYIIAKFFADNYLIHQTQLDYTILQPTVLVEAKEGDGKVSLGQVQAKQNTIPNVAKVLAALARHPETGGKVLLMSDGDRDVEEAFMDLPKG